MQNNSRKEKRDMKLFKIPEIEVMKFAAEDIIATSGGNTPPYKPATVTEEDFCI